MPQVGFELKDRTVTLIVLEFLQISIWYSMALQRYRHLHQLVSAEAELSGSID